MSKLQEKSSAPKREHPALQIMKFINFFSVFRVICAPLDPDPAPGTSMNPANPDPARTLIFNIAGVSVAGEQSIRSKQASIYVVNSDLRTKGAHPCIPKMESEGNIAIQ
jgi:hypothetical protein